MGDEEEEEEDEEEEDENEGNDMDAPEAEQPQIPLGPVDITKVKRNIHSEPRVTRFHIPWDQPVAPSAILLNGASNQSVDAETIPITEQSMDQA